MSRLAPFVMSLWLCACAQIPPVEVPMPAQSSRQIVVVDIDGTLTPQVSAILEARPGAAQVLRAFFAKGYEIVYLTARIPLFQADLPDWLQRNGFPEGNLHVAQTGEERRQVDQFKAGILNDYRQRGWRLAYAYGDSSTDFIAYASAGIPQQHVFALQRRGAEQCPSGVYHLCLNGWTKHLSFVERDVPNVK